MEVFISNLTSWNILGYVMYGLAFASIVTICIKEHKKKTFDARKQIALVIAFIVVLHYFLTQTYWLATYTQVGTLSFAKFQWVIHDALVGVVIAILLAIIETEK